MKKIFLTLASLSFKKRLCGIDTCQRIHLRAFLQKQPAASTEHLLGVRKRYNVGRYRYSSSFLQRRTCLGDYRSLSHSLQDKSWLSRHITGSSKRFFNIHRTPVRIHFITCLQTSLLHCPPPQRPPRYPARNELLELAPTRAAPQKSKHKHC